ncbi:LOW QUALITY PROTEIN: uncharacterized protein [Macrobrachium rosenbergii]|uniref:LOW QUALITY PROTEIN: uncharacterized protein n=1 Tax=Macrobrachium rosenbergii TaxID=79674 RepID=UPI0034D54F80
MSSPTIRRAKDALNDSIPANMAGLQRRRCSVQSLKDTFFVSYTAQDINDLPRLSQGASSMGLKSKVPTLSRHCISVETALHSTGLGKLKPLLIRSLRLNKKSKGKKFVSSPKESDRVSLLNKDVEEKEEFVRVQQAVERDERHERAEARKLELEAEERENLRQYELQKLKLSSPSSLGLEGTPNVETDRFGWTTVLKLVPKFSESDVSKYFQSFEKLMKQVECPKEYYCLLLQSVLTGKAQEVYSCLSDEQCANYETVKEIILKAYKQVPEAYRLKFRHFRKNSSMTFMEFARCKQQYFNEWCNSMEVSTLEDLKELILTEDFKNNIPAEMKLYIEECQVNKFTRIAELADEFALTHQFSKEWQEKKIHPKTFETKGYRQFSKEPVCNSQLKTSKHLSDMKCFFCEKKGHIIKDCFKHKTYLARQMKPFNLVSSGVIPYFRWMNGKILKSFGNYLSKGSLAVSESGIRKPVTVLRDTGAAISVVLKSSLPDDSVTGDEFILIGVSDACIPCPLQTIYLDTDYVTGLVKVAVTDTLPVKGVDILLGNDLGKESCLVNPIVMKTPVPEAEVAVVTRSGFCTDSDNYDLDLDSNVDSSLISVPLEISLQRDDLIRAQRDDVSLKHIFEKCEEGSGNDDYVKEKFILKNNLLHRLSRPIFANSNEVIDQVVIPFKLRPKIISLAHDNIMSGHLGVNKTLKKIYDSFYWPSLRRDVKNFVNSCHECQMAGKPNKPIPKAPLISTPVSGEPFEHRVTGIVGPLLRSKRRNFYILSTTVWKSSMLKVRKTKLQMHCLETLYYTFVNSGMYKFYL